MKNLKNLIYLPRRIKQFFINLFNYLPILWNDRHWDYAFILDLLEFKLKKMSKYHHSSNICVENKSIAHEIDYALKLLNNIKGDDIIFNDEYEELNRKYPNRDIINFGSEEEKNDYMNYYIKVRKEEQRLKNEFFNYLRDNFQKWWD